MTTVRGFLTAWDGTNYLATIRLEGSSLSAIANVKTSRAIPSAEMVTGRVVVLDTGNDAIAATPIVIAVVG